MRTKTFLTIALTATVLTTGCSIRQVQAWFSVRGYPPVAEANALSLAEKINATEPAGCDANYSGACIPTNVAAAHCIGEPGIGPEFRGPFTVTGWDHFGLDGNNDKTACPGTPPVGNLEVLNERGTGSAIVLSGWALDHDATGPIEVHVYDNGAAFAVPASSERSDLASLGRGTNHGFSTTWEVTPGMHEVCAFAINVGGGGTNTRLGCRTIEVAWEMWMLDIVNGHRAAAGVAPLTLCSKLTQSATAHSVDQASHDNMSHTGSDGSSAFERITRAGYNPYASGGENVAAGYGTVPNVMSGWMGSTGHRENILRTGFTHFGAGRAVSATGRLYWTQNFGGSSTC